ncbi:MAG: energy-coupling factor ABC transporter substrate-binding protein [Bacillota bacterium]
MSLTKQNIIILTLVAVIIITPLLIQSGAEFGGADGQAEGIINRLNADYQPWADYLWTPPSGEIESLLFALQAAIGALILGYYFGFKRAKAKFTDE